MSECKKPCAQCPWRLSNQGKRHRFGFYTKANLRRLWNEVRGGGLPQSCHPTDPTHPNHGAKPDSKPQECSGSVIVVLREVRKMADDKGVIDTPGVDRHLKTRRKGLTKNGIFYWVVSRMQMGGVPVIGGPKLPVVDENDPEIGLPADLS